jgi:hypothetical protein
LGSAAEERKVRAPQRYPLARRLDEMENKYDAQFKMVFDTIRELMRPPDKPRRRIGWLAQTLRGDRLREPTIGPAGAERAQFCDTFLSPPFVFESFANIFHFRQQARRRAQKGGLCASRPFSRSDFHFGLGGASEDADWTTAATVPLVAVLYDVAVRKATGRSSVHG